MYCSDTYTICNTFSSLYQCKRSVLTDLKLLANFPNWEVNVNWGYFCTATRAENLQLNSKEADSHANDAAKCSFFLQKFKQE